MHTFTKRRNVNEAIISEIQPHKTITRDNIKLFTFITAIPLWQIVKLKMKNMIFLSQVIAILSLIPYSILLYPRYKYLQ